ncbi:regulatory protein RecX [Carboxydothermus pertinax]|uniref:Regulatory protein RecX n=1 Tax=Carboxydothermus pertinax TaxID=870242 RepID=A0A1L8CW66_9THEO|nr:RecX family transcriptional regulator [Carboxydothermus pertinax]GAV23114.1 regulatory protein RecX [Carboxydothermus pertinax]
MNRAYQLALNYLSRALRTTEEVRRYLIRKGFKDDEIEEAITKLIELGYLDDKRYLENYLASSKMQKYGFLKVKLKLLQKGINPGLLNDLNFNEDEEVAKAKEILLKKYKYLEPAGYAKYYRFLLSRGFPPSVVQKALFLTDNMDNG